MVVSTWLSDSERGKAAQHPAITKWIIDKAEKIMSDQFKIAEEQSNEITILKEEKNSLRDKLENQTMVEDLTKQLEKQTKTVEDQRAEISKLQAEIKTSKDTLIHVENLANFRKDEISSLSEDLQNSVNQQSELRKKLLKTENEINSLKGNEVQNNLNLTQRKLELKDKEITWLKESLSDRTNELTEVRSNRESEILNLESRLEKLQFELQATSAKLLASEQQVAKSIRLAESELKKRNSIEHLAAADKREIEKQLETEEKLRIALKNRSEDQIKSIDMLEKQLAAKDVELGEVKERFNKDINFMKKNFEKELNNLRDQNSNEIENLKGINEKLKEDIKSNNERTKNLAQISAGAADVQLASQGLSSTALYQQLGEVREKNSEQEIEINRLKSYLKRILKEIEENAPQITQLKDNYMSSLEAYDEQAAALNEYLQENDNLRESISKLKSRLESTETDLEVARQDGKDLAHQVCTLLQTQYKNPISGSGMVAAPPKSVFNSNSNSFDFSNGSISTVNNTSVDGVGLIDANLVSINNIQDLQQQNQKLRSAARKLSIELENLYERNEEQFKEKECKQLRELKEELVSMRESRQRQEKMVVAIANQRDMYRVLLMQADAAHINDNSKEKSTVLAITNSSHNLKENTSGSGNPVSPSRSTSNQLVSKSINSGGVDYPSLLKELRIEFSEFREGARKSALELQKLIDQQKDTTSQARVSEASAIAEREHSKHQLDIFKSQLENAKQDLEREQKERAKTFEACVKAQNLFAERGREIDQLSLKVGHLGSDLSREKAAVTTANLEINILKENIEELKKQRDGQRKLTETYQQKLETGDSEIKIAYASCKKEVERIEQQLIDQKEQFREARQNAVNNELTLKVKIQDLEKQVDTLSKKSSTLSNTVNKNETELKVLNERELILREQLEEARKSKANLLAHGQASFNSKSAISTTISDSNFDIASSSLNSNESAATELKQEITKLRVQLDVKAKDAEAYRAISKSNEDALEKLSLSSEVFKKQQIEKFNALKNEKDAIFKRLETAEQSASKKTSEIVSKSQELEKELVGLKTKAKETERKLNDANKELSRVKEELEFNLKKVATERSNYERELQLHASATVALTLERERIETSEAERKKLQVDFIELKEKNRVGESVWSQEKESFQKQIASYKNRAEDAEKQIKLYVEQMTKISKENSNLTNRSLGILSTSTNTTQSEEAKEEPQSDEIIRLREMLLITERQRDVSVLEKEEVELQCNRAKKQHEAIVLELAKVKEELKNEVERLGGENSQVITLDEHKRLLASIQENSLIRGMNAMLVADKEKFIEQLKKKEDKIVLLEQKIKPYEAEGRKTDSIRLALEADKNALEKECQIYKERYDQLMKRFGDKIDPAELSKLNDELKSIKNQKERISELARTARKEVNATKKKLEAVEAEKLALETEKENSMKELATCKETLQKKENLLAKMRGKLVESNKLKAENVKLKTRLAKLIKGDATSDNNSSSKSQPGEPQSSVEIAIPSKINVAAVKKSSIVKKDETTSSGIDGSADTDNKNVKRKRDISSTAKDANTNTSLNASAKPFIPSPKSATSLVDAVKQSDQPETKRVRTTSEASGGGTSVEEKAKLEGQMKKIKEDLAAKKKAALLQQKQKLKAALAKAESKKAAALEKKLVVGGTPPSSSIDDEVSTKEIKSNINMTTKKELTDEEKINLRRQRFGVKPALSPSNSSKLSAPEPGSSSNSSVLATQSTSDNKNNNNDTNPSGFAPSTFASSNTATAFGKAVESSSIALKEAEKQNESKIENKPLTSFTPSGFAPSTTSFGNTSSVGGTSTAFGSSTFGTSTTASFGTGTTTFGNSGAALSKNSNTTGFGSTSASTGFGAPTFGGFGGASKNSLFTAKKTEDSKQKEENKDEDENTN